MKSYTRSKPIKTPQYLSRQSRHAWREDMSSQNRIRPDAIPGTCLSWSIDEGPKPDFDAITVKRKTSYLEAFKTFKTDNDIGSRKGAQIGIHLLAGVSPEWIEETGTLHDPNNPRNRQLFQTAIDWANSWSRGVYAARMDLDETGGGVVDLFVAPVRTQYHKAGKSKEVVSVNKSLEELSVEYFGKKTQHYAALNSSWAEYAAQHLDPRLERGTPKADTGKEHIPPDAYRALMQEAQTHLHAAKQKEAQAEMLRQELEQQKRDFDKKLAEARLHLSKEAEQHLNAECQRLAADHEHKVLRVVELTARAVSGVIDGTTIRGTRSGHWSVGGWADSEREEFAPYVSTILPVLFELLDVVEHTRELFEDLSDEARQQAAQAAMDSQLDIFTPHPVPPELAVNHFAPHPSEDLQDRSAPLDPFGP